MKLEGFIMKSRESEAYKTASLVFLVIGTLGTC